MRVLVLDEKEIVELVDRSAKLAVKEALETIQTTPDWMNIKQLASYLSCSTAQIRLKVKNDGLPYSERLGHKRFSKIAVDEWMNQK